MDVLRYVAVGVLRYDRRCGLAGVIVGERFGRALSKKQNGEDT